MENLYIVSLKKSTRRCSQSSPCTLFFWSLLYRAWDDRTLIRHGQGRPVHVKHYA